MRLLRLCANNLVQIQTSPYIYNIYIYILYSFFQRLSFFSSADQFHELQNVYSTPKAPSKALAGYEFDHDSNILLTPNQSATPTFYPKKAGIG